jgi:hypothetical protein
MSDAAILTQILGKLDAMDRGQQQLSSDVTRFRTDLMARMDRLQGRIEQLAQEGFVNYAQGEGVRRHAEHTRAEQRDMAEQISGLVRQVRLLRDRLDAIEGRS